MTISTKGFDGVVLRKGAESTVVMRNAVAYLLQTDGGLRMIHDSPNGMTYEYDAASGKRCRVSQSGVYLGEWF